MSLKQNTFLLLAVALLIIITGSELKERIHLITNNLPYATHMDEGYLLEPAKNILETGDFNPHNFNYPSLPFYLIAAGLSTGYLTNITQPDTMDSVLNSKQHLSVGRTHYPFYALPNVVKGAKVLFALLSALTLVCIAFIAYRAYGFTSLLFIPAALLGISNFYLYQSWFYLNVDILGAFFAVLTYASLFANFDKDTYLKRAVLPGAIAGLAIACKYTFYPIILLTPLALLLMKSEERYLKSIVAMGATIVTFLLASPYILLDFSTAIQHILGQVMHYKMGHAGHNVTPGMAQLAKYIQALIQDYGLFLSLLTLLGIGFAFYKHWKNTLIILFFPVLLLAYMSMQQVNFTRNITVIYAMLPIFSAMGVLCLYQGLQSIVSFLLQRFAPGTTSRKVTRSVTTVSLALIIIFLTPIERLFHPNTTEDTRVTAAHWLNQNVPAKATIIIDESLGFDQRTLNQDYNVGFINVKTASNQQLALLFQRVKNAYLIIPQFRGRLGPNGDTSQKRIALQTNQRLEQLLSKTKVVKKLGSIPVEFDISYAPYLGQNLMYMPIMNKGTQLTIYQF